MTVVVRTSNDLQNDKVTHFIGKMYGGSINSHGNFNPDDFNYLSMVHVNFREATSEETDWYSKGARALPKYQIGDTVKVVYIPDSDSELLYNVSMSQIGRINKITNIRFKSSVYSIEAEQYYVYNVDGWEVAENNLELMPKNASTYPITPNEAFKPFDKNNFLVSYNSMPSFRAYMELCDEYNIATYKTWKGVENYYYGIKNGQYAAEFYFEKAANGIPKYTFNEFKQLLTNKIEKNEVQRTNIKDSGRIINRGEGFSSRRQPSSIEGRLEGNKQSYYFRRKKAYISEIKGKIINKRTIRLL